MAVVRALVATVLTGVLIAVSGHWAAGAQSRGSVTLGLPEHTNATPSLAVWGRTVVAVWTATRGGIANVYAATSADSGATFSEPVRVNDRDGDASANNEQPPRVAISGTGTTRTISVMWSKRNEGPQRTRQDVIRIARSTDGGRTFSPARSLDDATSGARGWQSLATGIEGSVHAVWLDGRDAERKMAETLAHTGTAHKGLPPQDVYHASIGPDGRVNEKLITSGVCFCCKTAVAIGVKGAVYAAWRHIFPGSMRDIAFASSSDGGRNFGPIVRVSEDKWELNGCPEDGPAMAVDSSGVIHLAWTTLVDGEKALFHSTSRDGKAFAPRSRVPIEGITAPGHPQLVVTRDGSAAIVWDEVVGGARRVSFSVVSGAGAFRAPRVLSGNESALAPVLVNAEGGFLVAWTSRAPKATASDPSEIRMTRVSM